MKKVLVFALIAAFICIGSMSAQAFSVSETGAQGGVQGGTSGMFFSGAVTAAGVSTTAVAGNTYNGGSYSNVTSIGGSFTKTGGFATSGSEFFGQGTAYNKNVKCGWGW